MRVLEGLKPERVFYFFEEISRIPHGSGNEQAISDYLVSFAKEHELFHIQDAANNVIMIKEASEGYEEAEPIIFQGHMDMVAVKDPDSDTDPNKDPLHLETDGKYIWAKGTTLGADDGIAVAFALALLEDETLGHPRLEVVITTDEEVGMGGAAAVDLSVLKGKRLLNLDSEVEGIFTAGCAGGCRVYSTIPVSRELCAGRLVRIRIEGLLGGHSGIEIHKQRGNANLLMGRLLYGFMQDNNFGLYRLEGGTKDNAIACECEAQVVVDEEGFTALTGYCAELERVLRAEYAVTDPEVSIALGCIVEESRKWNVLNSDSLRRALSVLFATPNGVQAMSMDVEGLVESSLNMGILKLEENALDIHQSVRSSVASSKKYLRERVMSLAELAGGKSEIHGEYPAWEYRKDSPLRDSLMALYEKKFGKTAKVEIIHAGLECGLFGEKIEGLDAISFGPNLTDIHTTSEKMEIASVQRMYEFVREFLGQK